jgi:cation diffusion facilitator CzcD-associated flavoprotein CzcO
MAGEPTVVVVGAGIGGICVWDHLRRAGCRTVLLDAGPATVSGDQLTPGFVPEKETWTYTGIDDDDWIRVLAVGGRANVWGRWCGRF